jgi:anaerobic ribonucleoside-triphosphate reductase activating protein
VTSLRVNRTHYPVTALGYGRRLGIWLQGCPLACPGCMSRDTWPAAGGAEVAVTGLAEAVDAAWLDGADGLTISGGEPLVQSRPLYDLLEAVRHRCSGEGRDFDVLLYTGYELDELDADQMRAVDLVDVLVTGRFDITRPTARIWRGSANQVMHLRTELGRARYSSYMDDEPAAPPIQLGTDPDGFWLIGVPRPGTLAAVERSLRAAGVDLRSVSWRREPSEY